MILFYECTLKLFLSNLNKMWYRYKIFILPLVVFCFAVFFSITEKPIKLEKTTVSKEYPFPLQKESKTEWTKPNWSNEVSKTDSFFLCPIIKNKMYRPSVYYILLNEQEIFYSSNFFYKHNGRAPPNFS